MQSKTLLRDDVQLSREVPFTYISSNFITFFYVTCTYRHSKLKKGMEGPEHQERNGSTGTPRNNCNLYNNIEERCSTLKESSIYINSCQISSYFPILHVHTGTANSRKAWKYQNIKKQLKLVYKNTILPSYFIAIETFRCPNFKPRFPGILKI